MFEIRAGHSRAIRHQPRRNRVAGAAAWLLALTLLTLATGQQAPTITLGSYSYIVGETLELTASNLEAGAGYRVELTPPSVASEERASLVSVLAARPDGTLSYSSPLQYGGTYQVHVSGPRLDATLNVQVSGAESAIGQAPRSEQRPADEAVAEAEPEEQAPPSEAEQPTAAMDEPTEATPTVEEDDATASPVEEPGSPEATLPVTEPEPGSGEGPTPPDEGLDQSQAESTEPAPQAAPVQSAPATPPAGLAYSQVGDSIVAQGPTGTDVWRLDFPVGSGATAGLSSSATRLVAGHGNHLLELDAATGKVLARHRLPAQVIETNIVGSMVEVTVQYQDGSTGRVNVTASGVAGTQPFDTDPALYTWLRQEASVADPASRSLQDPTNPWLYVAQVQSAPSGAALATETLLQNALARSATFYERAQLADAFLGLPNPRQDLAATAMEAAMRDFSARGYRAELLTDPGIQDAYGFPLGRLMSALGRGDMTRAGFWADWLYRTSTPENPNTQAALREYALYLQEAGQRDEASLWRTRASEGSGRFQVGAILTSTAHTVGRTGWYGVAALIVSIIALNITLLAKYWRPQTLTMQRARAAGKNVSAVFARLTFMRYATWVEKLVVVLLFAAALALAALQGWSAQLDDAPRAWSSGSLGTPAAQAAVASLDLESPGALFVSGYAAQASGNEAAAEAAYRQLPDDAAALNNLGVLLGDSAYFNRALALEPGYGPALYNLGSGPNPVRWQAEFAAGEPLVVAPDAAALGTARAGTYLGAWRAAFTNPWAALTGLAGVSLAPWLWTVLVVLFLAWAAVSILLLVIPRPRLARNAPRTFLYHLLAILLPGTGLADEFWGVFLMVPWAIFGVDFLLNYLPGGPDPTMSLRTDGIALIVIYAVNLVAFFVEFGSYRRRMVALKQNDPQAAREFGLRVPAQDIG